jgi:hypothetical protein
LKRAQLAGRLRAAYDKVGFQILRGLAEEDALRKAIADTTREDAADRVEVAGLLLAVIDRRPLGPRVG